MTSSGGGFPSPQNELPLPCSPALGHRLSNVIDVHDPARIVECSQLERQRKFQYLVRRYLSQIRHGCKSAYCDTPTCLSGNKRGAAKPYRPPTELTARALAHYLASQDNPHRGLCPHELKVPPMALEAEVAIDSTPGDGSNSSVDEAQRATRMKTQALTSIIDSRHQLKKDTKSIGQNLYDSVSVIYSYSKSIPSALSVFDLLRASPTEGQAKRCHDGANGSPVTARTGNTTRQISRHDSRVQRQSEATREQPTVLSDGQLVHKRSGPDEAFINRSLFYTLGDAETLLKSFHDSNDAFKCSPLPHLDSIRLANSFRDWSQHNGALIFDSLSIAVEALLTRPPAFDQRPVNGANHESKSHQKVESASKALQTDSATTENHVVTPEETLSSLLVQHLVIVEQVALESKRKMGSTNTINKEPGWTVTATLAEWLKTTIIKNWDGKVEVNKWTSVGAAIMLLRQLHEHQRRLNIWSRMIRIPYLHEHMDALQDPVKFLDWRVQPNTLHVLQYAELHPTDYLVKFFRVINLTSMMSQYDHTQHVQQMLRQLDTFLREPYLYMIKHRLKVTLNDYLILDVSREQPLKDTLDQLWRQERKTLLKPLKVKLGQKEGEVGLDHGGVTYEFFRVVLGQAFAPEYGMFTIDSKTRMTWFQPGSLEPLWKFKMLGVLFSLAIYNGITLPVTFPLAFYNLMLNSRFKFLDDHTSIDYIRDGWPDLARSFETMLDWKDGDVADVFMRDYAFSYEAFGQKIDLDMSKNDNESHSSSDTPLVNNENRGMFVRDYVTYLILRTIRPQLKAFKKGFHTCLDPRSLELFTPKTLRQLVEGTQNISISDLRACATYEDYDATHPTVRMFWNIVQGFSQEDAARLLEFVTASDRVPITGYKSLTFNVVRMGSDSEQLPTSSTCFGKLYLPEYNDEDKMRRKLELAIQNAKGFGVV
ncbi:hypothetical protein E8E13_005009 [Curvularia kusanoi]|uniref:HECT-type E3 ubiquitin transferase n=1 Tax=Curvularia kusanoi TaxID=90978 RepID=A0A9P4TIJ6_CURKU|nr:hypothetical protein E8E13_005009 [Curvularia kusanoi]